MRASHFALVVMTVSHAACVGVKFSPDTLNGQAWPSELNARHYLKSAGVYSRNLAGLVGHVLYAKKVNGECPSVYSDADLSLKRYVLPDTRLEPDTTVVERFSDRIDNRAEVDASLLTVVSKLSSDQVAEVVVADTTTLIVPDEAIDIPRLQNLGEEARSEDVCDLYFIRGAIVTTITQRTAIEVSANATVSGSAFGANGKVYNATRRYSLDYRLGLSVLPVRARIHLDTAALRTKGAKGERKALEGLDVPKGGFHSR